MPHELFDRRGLRMYPLSERPNKVSIERDHVPVGADPRALTDEAAEVIEETATRLRAAREAGRSRMLAFGAHTIKNGLSPTLIALIKEGWFTHLATNGAGIIHDWEFAYQGASSEDVRANVAEGKFGAWDETGLYLNLALLVGAYEGLGYGESVGKLIEEEGLRVPSEDALLEEVAAAADEPARAAAAADLLEAIRSSRLKTGAWATPHPYKPYSVAAAAYRLGTPFTGHPMIGHDILYEHPLNRGAAVGRTAERDFLAFVQGVSGLDGGAYVSIGSAVMSPMIFEKALSMARNAAGQDGRRIDDLFLVVADLAKSNWDWSRGEPPEDDPAYYQRYNKTFARMGGTLKYMSADNRDVLLALHSALQSD